MYAICVIIYSQKFKYLKATPPKRRKPDKIKNDNIKDITYKDITKNFKETDNTEELRKFLLQIAQNII